MKRVILSALFIFVTFASFAQNDYSRMIIHNGKDSLCLPIISVDSVTFDKKTDYSDIKWGGNNSSQITHDKCTYDSISCYTHPKHLQYNDLYIDGNTVYAVTTQGVRKIDYSDKTNPTLISESTPFISNSNLLGRTIEHKGNNLYVGYRVSFTVYNQRDAQITQRFESLDTATKTSSSLSNNSTINAFFKALTISRDLGKVHQIFIYKAYKRDESTFSNVIVFKVSGEVDHVISSENYSTRQEALDALKSTYSSGSHYCEVDWEAVPEGNNSYSSLQFNFVAKQEYIHTANADYSISNTCCPNTGNRSGEFSINTQNGDTAVINYQLLNPVDKAEASFWIRIDKTFKGEVEIPLFSNADRLVYGLSLLPSGNSYQVSIDDAAGTKSFANGVWYNIKATYSNGVKKLYYRSKECSEWILIGTSSSSEVGNVETVSVGIQSASASAAVLFDDFRYSDTDVDAATYNKGRITVVDKNTLDIKKILYVDYPVTDMAVSGKSLIVSGLNGVNVYSLEDSDNPELTYTYRPSSFRDCQGITTYEHAGRVYAVVCKYTHGLLILDITDVNNVTVAADNEFDGWTYADIAHGINIFSAVIDYPYLYATLAPHPDKTSTIPEACGVVSFDLSDLNDIQKTLYLMDSSDITSNKSGDPSPTRIARYGNSLYLNNRDKGLAVYNILGDGVVEYKGLVDIGGKTSVNVISITDDGLIFMGDDSCSKSEMNINLYRISR